MPVEGGFYRWVRAAFGDFWGFLAGWWNWSASFLLGGAYAVLFTDYLKFWFADNSGKPELQIIRKEDVIGTTQQERSGPDPPACQESPEITKSGAYPAPEATLHGHGRGQT